MPVFTVHKPPAWIAGPLPDPERFVFVRDGFSFWAFLLAPIWMLRHRMWLAVTGYVIAIVGIGALLGFFGASRSAGWIVWLLISLLVGFEASTLRRFALRRRGWSDAGVVSGDEVEDAERRFFDAWLRRSAAPGAPAQPPPLPGTAAAPSRAPRSPDVIGLFPQPGARP